MARSLLRQLEQIRRSATYDDAVASVNTSAVAEPTTISGYLEEDLNVIRTLVHEMKTTATGTHNWYDSMDKYFDPTDTDIASVSNKDMNFESIRGKTTDSQTVIIAVSNDNSGAGWSVSPTSTGVLCSGISTRYTDAENRTGLPVYLSNFGSYFDETGLDRVCRVDILDMSNDQEFQNTAGETVYGKLWDGRDGGGTGPGTDVFVKFYAGAGVPCNLSTISGTTPSAVQVIYPQRKVMSDMAEYEWLRTDFVSAWEGDVELVEDIYNLWGFTGSGDDISDPTWTNKILGYPLSSNPPDLETGIDLINDAVGDRDYEERNYVVNGESIADSIDKLDQALKDIEDDVSAGVGEKYVESVGVEISANVEHLIPYGVIYTPHGAGGREGKNMDVYVDGQLLAADTGSYGVEADRDYGETTTSGVTFRFTVQVGRNITYVARQ